MSSSLFWLINFSRNLIQLPKKSIEAWPYGQRAGAATFKMRAFIWQTKRAAFPADSWIPGLLLFEFSSCCKMHCRPPTLCEVCIISCRQHWTTTWPSQVKSFVQAHNFFRHALLFFWTFFPGFFVFFWLLPVDNLLLASSCGGAESAADARMCESRTHTAEPRPALTYQHVPAVSMSISNSHLPAPSPISLALSQVLCKNQPSTKKKFQLCWLFFVDFCCFVLVDKQSDVFTRPPRTESVRQSIWQTQLKPTENKKQEEKIQKMLT